MHVIKTLDKAASKVKEYRLANVVLTRAKSYSKKDIDACVSLALDALNGAKVNVE